MAFKASVLGRQMLGVLRQTPALAIPLRSRRLRRHRRTPRCASAPNRDLPEDPTASPVSTRATSGSNASSSSAAAAAAAPASSLFAGSGGHVNFWRAEPKRRLRVAVDVDEVLAQFLVALNQFCLDEYGMKYDLPDYYEYVFAKIWGCDQSESNRIVHEFFKSRHFAEEVPPIPGAFDALQRIGTFADLVVVTSRQHVIREPTLRWIEKHFPGTFQDVHFGNHWALEGKSKPKSEICREVGAHVLIDDNPIYARDCSNAGIHVLLYDWKLEYPWSKTADGPHHPKITRVQSWDEVERSLAALAAAMAKEGTAQAQGSTYLP